MNNSSREALLNEAAAKPDLWFTPGRFAFLLAGCIFAACPEVVLGVRAFFFRDFGLFGYPMAFHHRESFWQGEIPLWNPLNDFGMPFLAQWNTLVLYPGSLFYLLLPPAWSLSVFCLAHQLWAGLGMYWLAWRWTGSRLGATVAGMAFAFNGLTLNCLMWPNNIAALGWMPWTVLCVERGWKTGGKPLFLGSVVAAVQVLTGAPEIILFTWVILTLVFITNLFDNRAGARGLVLTAGSLVVIVATLSSIQLLPFLDLLVHSERNSESGTSFWSMPTTGWANFLVPPVHCARAMLGVFFQHKQLWTSSYYAGVATLAVAIFAVARVRAPRVRLLGALAIAGVALAMGDDGYLYKWLRPIVPILGFVRFPVKFVVLTIFSLPLLAAHTFGWWEERGREGAAINKPDVAAVWLTVLALIGFVLWLAHRYPFPSDDWAETWKNGVVRAALLSIFLSFTIASFQNRSVVWRRFMQAATVLTLGVDLITHVPRQNPTIQPAAFEPGLVRLSPKPGIGVSRVRVTPHAFFKLEYHSVASGLNNYLGARLALSPNCNLLDGIPTVDGFFSLYLPEAREVASLYFRRPTDDLESLTDFLNVSHVTAPGKLFDWDFRSNFLPFVTAGQQPLFLDKTQTLKSLCATNFAPNRIVYLPVDAEEVVRAVASAAQVRASHFSAHHGEIDLIAPHDSVVVVSQAYYHAWRAYVDGRPARIWRANYAFQALELPAGTHQVKLVYEDNSFRVGALISCLSLAALIPVLAAPPKHFVDK